MRFDCGDQRRNDRADYGKHVSPRHNLCAAGTDGAETDEDGALPLLPVVSKEALPKNKVLDCAAFLRGVTAVMPVRTGDVVVADILGLGVDIVASRDMAKK